MFTYMYMHKTTGNRYKNNTAGNIYKNNTTKSATIRKV